MSVLVWAMVGIAIWHFCVFVADRFAGAIIGTFLAALGGAIVSGYALPSPGVPLDNPPGIGEAIWPIPGSLIALVATYLYGSRREREAREALPSRSRPRLGDLLPKGRTRPARRGHRPRVRRESPLSRIDRAARIGAQ